jgi:6-phosphogluconolactonase (cycloisomerase 2 family)
LSSAAGAGGFFKNEAECPGPEIEGARGSIPNLMFRAAVQAHWRKMRMKFNKSGQLLLVSAASLVVAGLLTACGATNTVDFVYVTSAQAAGTNNYGEVNVFEVNVQSGFMRQIPTSPFPSGGRNPVADAVSTDDQNLYVVNQDDNSIVQFAIGTDGKLYPQNTVNTPGIYPSAIAVSGANLFVLDTYQPLNTCSNASPCSGSIAAYPIQASTTTSGTTTEGGALGTPLLNGNLNYWPLSLPGNSSDILKPTGVSVLASGDYLNVAVYDTTANAGYIFGFWIVPAATNPSIPPTVTCPPVPSGLTALPAGTLCPLNSTPVSAGIKPSAIASDPSGSHVYVTDAMAGTVLGYSIQNGALTPLTGGAAGGNSFPAGGQPSAVVVDQSGSFLYVTNFLDATVTAYSISSGVLTRANSYATGLQPVAMCIDPSQNHYLYTINYLGSSLSGFEVNSTDGSLINTQNSPYRSNALPTAMAAIPHNTTASK